MKVVRLTALRTGRLYPQVLIFRGKRCSTLCKMHPIPPYKVSVSRVHVDMFATYGSQEMCELHLYFFHPQKYTWRIVLQSLVVLLHEVGCVDICTYNVCVWEKSIYVGEQKMSILYTD